jgi:microsomal epoxide hydrolase
MSSLIEPFPISVPEAQLADLRERPARTRRPERETEDTSQGPRLAKVQALCEYWRDGYDRRRCEEKLNGFGSFRTALDHLGIHFLHVRPPEPDALPLVMTHGWPGSVVEFHNIIDPLTDSAAHGLARKARIRYGWPGRPGFSPAGDAI